MALKKPDDSKPRNAYPNDEFIAEKLARLTPEQKAELHRVVAESLKKWPLLPEANEPLLPKTTEKVKIGQVANNG